MRRFTVIVEQDEDSGWLVASVPTLRGCIAQARTWEELILNVRDAMAAYLETVEKDSLVSEGDGVLVGVVQLEVE